VYGDPDDAPADDAESAAGDNPDDSADGGNNQKSKKKTSKKRTAKKREPPKKDPFVWKPAMLGRVVAIGQADPFPGEKADWQWVFNTISPARWKWRLRQGLSLDSENPAFYNFLIADVGLPPIRTYRVLISLFVIVIGPLNYWFLRRHGRLHLLLFTVPAAALLASGSLIGYVIVADGFESRIRARSFTQLDQRHHEAVSWSRLSYYTGLSPSGGLLFPDDTVILPLEKSPRWDSLGARTRHMAWPSDGNEQRLARGWLASRTPTQYVAIRAAETERELTIRPSDDGQNCAVKNRLGTKIKRLLVCDAAGKLHVGADIDPLAQADLRLLEVGDGTRNALIEFREALTHDVPRMPEPGESELANSGFFPSMRRARFGWQNMGNDHDTARSVLESEIDRIGAACLTEKFAPRTYVAIVERPDDVPVGIESLIETQSLHVISGTW
jgi:hypothetical protein